MDRVAAQLYKRHQLIFVQVIQDVLDVPEVVFGAVQQLRDQGSTDQSFHAHIGEVQVLPGRQKSLLKEGRQHVTSESDIDHTAEILNKLTSLMGADRYAPSADQVGERREFLRVHRLFCRGILLLSAQILPVLFGRHSVFRSEIPVESGYVDKTAVEGDIGNTPVSVADIPYGMLHAHMVQINAETAPEVFSEEF